jgi:predicted DNA-binding WGR domain protein
MNAVHLLHIDPARNMHRFYRLDVQPDLFGGVLLVKEWARAGAWWASVTTAKPCRRRYAAAGRAQETPRIHGITIVKSHRAAQVLIFAQARWACVAERFGYWSPAG